jgi:hypothetical protein
MTDMTFAKQAGAALLAIALLSSPALADPPNAGLTSIVDGKLQTATVSTTLTFQARVLEGTPPTSGGTSSIFIDSGCNMGNPRNC